MNRILEIRERAAKYGLSRIAKDEVAWWNARDELNFNAYDDLQYLLQDHTRLTAEIESLTAERDRFKARAEAAEVPDAVLSAIEDMKQAVAYNGHSEMSRACSELWRVWDEWRGPQEGANP